MPIQHIHKARVDCDICGRFITETENLKANQVIELPEKETFDGRRSFTLKGIPPMQDGKVVEGAERIEYTFEVFVKSTGPEPVYCISCAMRVFTKAREQINAILKDITPKVAKISRVREERAKQEENQGRILDL